MYGDIPGDADGEYWRWVQDLCVAAVDLAIEHGWVGICTSNFSQPHFPGIWRDKAWHRELTHRIRANS